MKMKISWKMIAIIEGVTVGLLLPVAMLQADVIIDQNELMMETIPLFTNITTLINTSVGALEKQKELQVAQARVIENLTVMLITYQLDYLHRGLPPPDFDNMTYLWLRNHLPLEPMV